MAVDAHANFGYGIITTAPSPRDSGTSCNISSADATSMPAVPFNAVAFPPGLPFPTASSAEIVRVTANASGALTIARAQESTTAKSIDVGWQLANVASVKVFTDIEAALNPTGAINPYAGKTAPANWLGCDGTAQSRTTYAALFAVIAPVVGTFTVTIATPAVVTLNGHGLVTGDSVYLTTTSALPTGLVANTLYYVIKIDANSFNLATSRANAYAATKIATSGTQSGVHTLTACPFGLGDGSTTFNVPDLRGRVPAGADAMMGASAAGRLSNLTIDGQVAGGSGGLETYNMQHTHGISITSDLMSGLAAGVAMTAGGTNINHVHGINGNTGTGASTTQSVIQPTLVLNYIIKT